MRGCKSDDLIILGKWIFNVWWIVVFGKEKLIAKR